MNEYRKLIDGEILNGGNSKSVDVKIKGRPLRNCYVAWRRDDAVLIGHFTVSNDNEWITYKRLLVKNADCLVRV